MSASTRRSAVFLDKDGTLIRNIPYNVDPAQIFLIPHALSACAALPRSGFDLVVVSNQSGIARGLFLELDGRRHT
jgi:D-glycero-D-manno-heptose 1,7-bisphosphate phosphatase